MNQSGERVVEEGSTSFARELFSLFSGRLLCLLDSVAELPSLSSSVSNASWQKHYTNLRSRLFSKLQAIIQKKITRDIFWFKLANYFRPNSWSKFVEHSFCQRCKLCHLLWATTHSSPFVDLALDSRTFVQSVYFFPQFTRSAWYRRNDVHLTCDFH